MEYDEKSTNMNMLVVKVIQVDLGKHPALQGAYRCLRVAESGGRRKLCECTLRWHLYPVHSATLSSSMSNRGCIRLTKGDYGSVAILS